MTNFEYASHINEVAGLDLSLDCKEIDLQDKLYGLFQCFMPDGAGIEAVFARLQNGTELQARIMPIYAGGLFKALFQAVSGRMAGRV